jgi:DNA-directed RNA polymerase specialized sigma24 family protein
MQKTVLTLRYVEGLEWHKVAAQINYTEAGVYVLHGRALWIVKKWMEGKHERDSNGL